MQGTFILLKFNTRPHSSNRTWRTNIWRVLGGEKKKAESRRCMMYNNREKYVSSHRPSSSSSAAAAADTSGNAAIPYHLLLNHQVHNQVTVPFSPSPLSLPHSASGGATGDDDFPMRDERFPQWSIQEIRDLIGIRAQFELELVTAKRGENLWETVSNRMMDKGYRKTPDQCKCRWNILVTKYKDYETCDVDNNTHYCPFFDELHEIFASRPNPTHLPHISVNPVFTNSSEALGHAPKTQTQAQAQTQTQAQTREGFSQEPDNKEHETEPEQTQSPKTRTPPKRKTVGDKKQRTTESVVHPEPSRKNAEDAARGLHDTMRAFIMSQLRMDMQWRESEERFAGERAVVEEEWRSKVEVLERERLRMEQAFREREEQRRSREERRAERRDALLTMLLNKLARDENL